MVYQGYESITLKQMGPTIFSTNYTFLTSKDSKYIKNSHSVSINGF